MQTGSKYGNLNINDLKLAIYVALMTFLGNIIPALTAFQQTFNWMTFEHSLLTAAIGMLITFIVQIVRPT